MRVLIVEDDPAARRALERWLQQHGHTTCWAETSSGAIRQLVVDHTIDLILLDMQLRDGTTGWEVATFRYFDARTRTIPMVVTSGAPPEEIRFRARQNVLDGVALILDKPLDLRTLERYIESLL